MPFRTPHPPPRPPSGSLGSVSPVPAALGAEPEAAAGCGAVGSAVVGWGQSPWRRRGARGAGMSLGSTFPGEGVGH